MLNYRDKQLMIAITINESEKKRLLYYAENELRSGHWGSSDIEIPQEKVLHDKINKAVSEIELSLPDTKLLFQWFLNATDHGLILLSDDISIIHKIIYKLYNYYEIKKNQYIIELDSITDIIKSSINILPNHKFSLPVEYLKELERIENNKILKELHDNIYGKSSTDINETNIVKSEEPGVVRLKPSTEKQNYLSNFINKLIPQPNKIDDPAKSDNHNRSNETLDAKELLNKSKALSRKLKKLK